MSRSPAEAPAASRIERNAERRAARLARRGRSHNAIRPTSRAALGIAVLAIVAAVLPITPVLPALLAVALVGCLLTDWWTARNYKPSVDQAEIPTLALASPYELSATVTGTERARVTRLRQPAPSALRVDPALSATPQLSATLTGVQRGVHELPPPVIRTSGPLGLASVDHTTGRTRAVTVYPDLPRARKLAAARRRGRTSDEGRIRARLGLGTEFETIRDYTPDDDIRQVNWVATSRVGRPMSNQYRIDENRDVMFVVDAGRLMASPIGRFTRLDIALDALAVVAVAADESGDRVGALAFDDKVTRQLAPRRRGAATIVRSLFDIQPAPVDSDYERAFYVVGRQKRALVVLFTDLFEEAAARTLINACPVLGRHHALLVVSCTDPDIASRAAIEAKDVRDVMRQSVALDISSSHDRSRQTLESLGASVVEGNPSDLGPAAVQAYLRLKARARL